MDNNFDFCKYVNVFQGCGEIDLPKPEGIAAKWFFIKAGCGNTTPAACVPFGAMSVGPFSGGYPSGYGDHLPNSHSHPPKFDGGKKLLGFAHLQQSGTGAIGYYYNYAVITPRYADSPLRREPADEAAAPGCYSCFLKDIKCELTASHFTAFHRYTFAKDGGYAVVDFDNNGLNIPEVEKRPVNELTVKKENENTITAEAVIEGVRIFFAVSANGTFAVSEKNAVITPDSAVLEIKTAISARSREKALSYIKDERDFDTVKKDAFDKWNRELSKIAIKTDDEKIKEIFYSNLYHSFVKPCDRSGENFITGGDGPFCVDFNTLWDMYKTALPLIIMTNRDIAEKCVETLLCVGETLGQIPNSLGVSDEYKVPTEQARMLGAYVLITAYRYGIDLDVHRMLRVIEKDVFAPNKYDFTRDHRCLSHTWMLDMADCCALASEIAEETGEAETAKKLRPLSLLWKTAYDKNTGLLDGDSKYYEGTLYNYSFRQMVDMDERIALAGGNEKFVELLDRFFGYGAEDTVQPTDPHNYEPVAEGMKLGRFEGFNNESDTEAPFSYIYAGRHDRTCEILRAGMKYMFTTGRGGIPGNNDSGALSSYYVFAALGLFPVAGQDLFLFGSPFVDNAEIALSNGNRLIVKVIGNSDENIYVKSITFNGKAVEDYRISAHELLSGGQLVFTMA